MNKKVFILSLVLVFFLSFFFAERDSKAFDAEEIVDFLVKKEEAEMFLGALPGIDDLKSTFFIPEIGHLFFIHVSSLEVLSTRDLIEDYDRKIRRTIENFGHSLESLEEEKIIVILYQMELFSQKPRYQLVYSLEKKDYDNIDKWTIYYNRTWLSYLSYLSKGEFKAIEADGLPDISLKKEEAQVLLGALPGDSSYKQMFYVPDLLLFFSIEDFATGISVQEFDRKIRRALHFFGPSLESFDDEERIVILVYAPHGFYFQNRYQFLLTLKVGDIGDPEEYKVFYNEY